MKKLQNILIFLLLNVFAWANSNLHFVPDYLESTQNPFNSHTIKITSALLNEVDLELGDEIGVFDGDICVGAGIVEETLSTNNMLEIPASAQNGDIPGFTSGNEISYRFWDASSSSEILNISASYLQGSGIFNQLSSSYVSLEAEFSNEYYIEITDGCDLPDSNIKGYMHLSSDGSVFYKTPTTIGGFQFDVDGATVSSGSGGDAGTAGLNVSAAGSFVLAFSMSGATIPVGCGTLTNLSLNGDATGLSNIIVSDATANPI
ncbi:MAG: hypothetical protein VX820_05590, partial [Candidatus Neomarinimicrobiota bacterium]|nr:hypothetical protein [Candidatus Neomarinimicrobiota bacterium]